VQFLVFQMNSREWDGAGVEIRAALLEAIEAKYDASCSEEMVELALGQRDEVLVCWSSSRRPPGPVERATGVE